MGEPKNLHFHDLGIFGRVPEPQHQYYLFVETPGYLNKSRNHWNMLETHSFYEYQNVGNPKVWKLWKNGLRTKSDDPSNDFLKSWIWDHIAQKAWNGNLVIWDKYLPKILHGFLNIWNFETLKPKKTLEPRNQDILKTRNKETKKQEIENQETLKPRNQEANTFFK